MKCQHCGKARDEHQDGEKAPLYACFVGADTVYERAAASGGERGATPEQIAAVVKVLGWTEDEDHHGKFWLDATGVWVAEHDVPAKIIAALRASGERDGEVTDSRDAERWRTFRDHPGTMICSTGPRVGFYLTSEPLDNGGIMPTPDEYVDALSSRQETP